jgi:hypothetical protein
VERATKPTTTIGDCDELELRRLLDAIDANPSAALHDN